MGKALHFRSYLYSISQSCRKETISREELEKINTNLDIIIEIIEQSQLTTEEVKTLVAVSQLLGDLPQTITNDLKLLLKEPIQFTQKDELENLMTYTSSAEDSFGEAIQEVERIFTYSTAIEKLLDTYFYYEFKGAVNELLGNDSAAEV